MDLSAPSFDGALSNRSVLGLLLLLLVPWQVPCGLRDVPKLFAFPSRQICGAYFFLQFCRGSRWNSAVILSSPMATESLTIDETKYYGAIFAASHIGSITVRITANANTATAKVNATTRTLRCSNFPEALAKKSTAANKTVFARY